MVPVVCPAADRASDCPDREILGHRVFIATLAELAAGEKFIYPDKVVPFPALLVFQHGAEHPIAVIQGGFSQIQAPGHPTHILPQRPGRTGWLSQPTSCGGNPYAGWIRAVIS